MSRKELEHAFEGVKDCTSDLMQEAVDEWFELYFQEEATEEEDSCQRLPALIVSKLSRACFGEYEAKSHQVFGQKLLQSLGKVRRKAVQLTLIGGEAWLKPIPQKDGFVFEVMRRDAVAIFSRNQWGDAEDLASARVFWEKGGRYTLVERRTQMDNGVKIQNRLFYSKAQSGMGVEVPLSQSAQCKDLQAEIFLNDIPNLGLVRLFNEMENCVDGSLDSVSIYAPAVALIHNINRNEKQLWKEFEHGESRVFASADLLRRRPSGDSELPKGLFVGLDDDPQSTGLTIYSPQLRQESFLQRKKEYLRNLESLIGLKRGLLSEVDSLQRTAAEVTGSSGDYSLTIREIQQIWERGVEQAVVICGKLGKMYGVLHSCEMDFEKDISICWGDGILSTTETKWQETLQMVQMGLLKPEIAVAQRFRLPWETQEQQQMILQRYLPNKTEKESKNATENTRTDSRPTEN